jgi:hypothetical protein
MADKSEDDAREGRAEDRFNKTLRRPGYWSLSRVAVAVLVLAAFIAAGLLVLG